MRLLNAPRSMGARMAKETVWLTHGQGRGALRESCLKTTSASSESMSGGEEERCYTNAPFELLTSLY